MIAIGERTITFIPLSGLRRFAQMNTAEFMCYTSNHQPPPNINHITILSKFNNTQCILRDKTTSKIVTHNIIIIQ